MNTSANRIANILLVTTMHQASSPRPLYIDFDQYGDGDAEFKEQLTVLMIGNIRELQQDLHQSISQQTPDIFKKACHKVKVALHMLDDKEFTNITEELKGKITSGQTGNCFSDQIALFDTLCDAIVNSLELEAGIRSQE